MYKNPIELIYKDAQYRMEKDIFYAIQKVDIKVDRDELLKALAYDRGQYEKGYEDAKAERKKGKWIAQKGGGYRCSECKHYALDERDGNLVHVSAKTKFCPYCGVDMREETTDE